MTDQELLYKAAKAYYEEDMTQEEVARLMNLSRIKVSRMLREARDRGIVHVTVRPLKDPYAGLAYELRTQYHLKEIVLVDSLGNGSGQIAAALGAAGAEYLKRILRGREKIALSWGDTMNQMVTSMPHLRLPDAKVIQMLGGVGSPESTSHGSNLVRRLSEKLGSPGRLLTAPGVLAGREARNALLAVPHINETLNQAAAADIACVGIGIPESGPIRKLKQLQILEEKTLGELATAEAVGDICLNFFDIRGNILSHGQSDQLVGLSLEALKKIPTVLALAGGRRKRNAVLGALKTGIIDVLITDSKTGVWLKNRSRQADTA